jgi:hypothetical protein
MDTLQRKSHSFIPRQGIALPQSVCVFAVQGVHILHAPAQHSLTKVPDACFLSTDNILIKREILLLFFNYIVEEIPILLSLGEDLVPEPADEVEEAEPRAGRELRQPAVPRTAPRLRLPSLRPWAAPPPAL